MINSILSQLFSWINVVVNAVAGVLLAPVATLPGWLSNTIISAVMGVVLLILFKYTSNQQAIGRVRDGIKADMLALKLFKDELRVTFQSQGRLFGGAMRLLFHSLRPLAVMILPVALVLVQMYAWYQFRPLRPGEKALVTLKLAGAPGGQMLPVRMDSTAAAEVTIGPLRIDSQREVRWEIQARENGRHKIIFTVGGESFSKDLVIDEAAGFKRISSKRPEWSWPTILEHPLEKPFRSDSLVQSISIDYPERESYTSGADWWMGYFFVVSMIFALMFKPFLNVRI